MKKQRNNIFNKEFSKFSDSLNGAGVKMTQAREIVFRETFHNHGHFSAEDLVKVCKDRDVNVSRATIYRTLNELLEAKVIRKTAFGEKHNNFEHIYDEKPHHHARCIRCQEIFEFPDLKEDKIYKPVLEKQGFKVIGHEMHFYGLCRNCQD